MLNGLENPGNKLVYFMAMNNVKFRRPVVPGDQLVLEVTMVSRRSKFIQMRGQAFVDGNLVAEGDFSAAIVDREDIQQNQGNHSDAYQLSPVNQNSPTK